MESRAESQSALARKVKIRSGSVKKIEFQTVNLGIFHIWINSLRKAHPQDVVVALQVSWHA